MNSTQIHEKALSIINEYHTSDPFKLCSCIGLNVRYADLGSLKGMYKSIAGNYFVIINSSLSEQMSKIVCFHELCHHLLHSHIGDNLDIYVSMLFDMSARPEMEANMLATELMISDEDMLECAREGKTLDQIAATLDTDVHFVAIKAALMKERGYSFFKSFDIQSDFLKN